MINQLPRDMQTLVITRLYGGEKAHFRATSKACRELVDDSFTPSEGMLMTAGRRAAGGQPFVAHSPPPGAPLCQFLDAVVCSGHMASSGEVRDAAAVCSDLKHAVRMLRAMAAYRDALERPSTCSDAEDFYRLHTFIRACPAVLQRRLSRFDGRIGHIAEGCMVGGKYVDQVQAADMNGPLAYGYHDGRPFLAVRGIAYVTEIENGTENRQKEAPSVFVFSKVYHDADYWCGIHSYQFIATHPWPQSGPQPRSWFEPYAQGHCNVDESLEESWGPHLDDILLSQTKSTTWSYHRDPRAGKLIWATSSRLG